MGDQNLGTKQDQRTYPFQVQMQQLSVFGSLQRTRELIYWSWSAACGWPGPFQGFQDSSAQQTTVKGEPASQPKSSQPWDKRGSVHGPGKKWCPVVDNGQKTVKGPLSGYLGDLRDLKAPWAEWIICVRPRANRCRSRYEVIPYGMYEEGTASVKSLESKD